MDIDEHGFFRLLLSEGSFDDAMEFAAAVMFASDGRLKLLALVAAAAAGAPASEEAFATPPLLLLLVVVVELLLLLPH